MGEAHGQAAAYGNSDPSEQAIGVALRNRLGDPTFVGNGNYLNMITAPGQVHGLNTALTTGSDSQGQPIAELLNAAAVFGGTSSVSVGNAKCWLSPTYTEWTQIQTLLQQNATTVPRSGIPNDPKCFGPHRQLVIKTSISQNTNGSGAPAFVFEQWKALTDRAVIQIP